MTHTLSLNISTPLNHLFHTSNVKIYIFRHDQHLLRPTRDNCYKAGRIEGRKCQRLELFTAALNRACNTETLIVPAEWVVMGGWEEVSRYLPRTLESWVVVDFEKGIWSWMGPYEP